MYIHFHSKKYNTGYRINVKEFPTDTQLDEIKKEVQERIKIEEESKGYPLWLDLGELCGKVVAKYVTIGESEPIATIEI